MRINGLNLEKLKLVVKDLNDGCDRIKDIILFGSYAKGTARKNSDIDILILLYGSLSEPEDFVNYPICDMETMVIKYNYPIHCTVVADKDYIAGKHKELLDVPGYGISIISL